MACSVYAPWKRLLCIPAFVTSCAVLSLFISLFYCSAATGVGIESAMSCIRDSILETLSRPVHFFKRNKLKGVRVGKRLLTNLAQLPLSVPTYTDDVTTTVDWV